MRKKSSSQPSMLSGAVVLPLPSYRPPAGGQRSHAPEFINRRAQVAPDRWVSLTTVWRDGHPVYRVGVVDSRGNSHRDPDDYPTPLRARNAANKLYNRLTEED